MRSLGVWAVGVALLAGLTVVSAAGAAETDKDDDKPAKEADKPAWFSQWFGNGKKETKKPAARPDKDADKKQADAQVAEDRAATARRVKDEQATLLRRLAVCDQLRMVAENTDDKELRRQADRLEKQAWETFTRHARSLPGGLANVGSDEQVLEKHLGPGAPARAGRSRGSDARTGNARAAKEDVP